MAEVDVHTLAGPYVLNALRGDELREFEQHLVYCQWCNTEVAELREAAIRLSAEVAIAPPPGLHDKVMTAVAQLRQLPPVVPAESALVPTAVTAGRRVKRLSILALAAAALVAAGFGGIAIDQHRHNSGTEAVSNQIAAILAESDARTVHGAVAGGGQATIVVSVQKDAAVVVLHELRAVPAGRVYQLWLVDGKQTARSIGLVTSKRGADQTRLISRGLAGTVAFSLTVEPEGGSTKPTTPSVATIWMA